MKDFDDEYKEVWAEAMKEQEAYDNEVSRINNRIIKILTAIKGKAFAKSLKLALSEWECSGALKIVRKVHGQWQNENFGSIKKACIDQSSFGDSGDSFYGNCYVEIRKATLIKPALYLKCPFST